MELPDNGPHFLNRLFLSAPLAGEKLAAGSTYVIKWRRIGAFKKAYLQYDTGAGWKPVADSVDNNGSYPWKVPDEPTTALRLRLTGPAYVAADSSRGNLQITGAAGVLPRASERAFRFADQTLFLAPGAVLDIQDVSGKQVRALETTGRAAWDFRDGQGNRVEPGLYFARPRGAGGARAVRAWVF